VSCVHRLTQRDATAALLHLDPQIETKKTEVAHFETCQHLELELHDLIEVVLSDDEDVDVHYDEEPWRLLSTLVHIMFTVTVFEAELLQRCVELCVPCPVRLAEAV
jgi:hypothetical protein